MGFSNPSGCARATSYEDCDTHFRDTQRPRRKGWEDDERPLDDTRKHHYRIVQGKGAAYYDVMLYVTCMARYYKPVGDERRVCYNSDPRSTSSQFMWRVTHSGKLMEFSTTTRTVVKVPVGPGGRYSGFGADLYFVRGHLDISRSSHRPIEVYRMSDELKAWKREVKKSLAPVFELMKYAAAEAATTQGAIVAGYHGFHEYMTTHWQLQRQGWAPLEPLNEESVKTLVEMYNERIERMLDTATKTLSANALIRAVETSLVNALVPMFRGKPHRYESLPQFPEHAPSNFRFA